MDSIIIDFGGLKVDITQSAVMVRYNFSGEIDESFEQQRLPRMRHERIEFGLRDVRQFNSCGIREWITFLRDVKDCGNIFFVGCSVTMIDQINLIPDTLGKHKVVSFFAPYFCATHREQEMEINLSESLQDLKKNKAPEKLCAICSSKLEFDALEESYFLFLENLPGNLQVEKLIHK